MITDLKKIVFRNVNWRFFLHLFTFDYLEGVNIPFLLYEGEEII